MPWVLAQPDRTNRVNHPFKGTVEGRGSRHIWLSRQGLPVTVDYDNGPQFRPDWCGEYCTHYIIQRIRIYCQMRIGQWESGTIKRVRHEKCSHRPLSRRLDRCDHMIQNGSQCKLRPLRALSGMWNVICIVT